MRQIITLILIIAGFQLQASNGRYRLTLRDNPSTSVVVGWDQLSGDNPTLYYGTTDHGTDFNSYSNSKLPDRTVSEKGMDNTFARLTGLQPDTAYYFVIRDSQGTSERFWFKTAPGDKSRLSFIAGGDSRNNRAPRLNANRLVAKLKPHAVFFGGDMTDDDTDDQWQTWFDDWQLTIASDGRIFPIVAARGNHEDSNDSIYNLFDTPSSSVYYAITFGDNLIRSYTLNTETSISGNQTDWLEDDLGDNADIIWKMAQYHKPMRPHVFSKSEGNTEYNNWADLFYENQVKLVVESDSHNVKTTWPVRPSNGSGNDEGFIRDDENGTIYVGEGCWGAPLRGSNDAKDWTRDSGSFNQFKWIFVDENKIEIRTVKVDNESEVGSVSNNDPFRTPSNLDTWNPSNGSVVTINNENVDPADPGNENYTAIPALVQAEDFDTQSGVQTENSDDNGGGENVGYIDTGDFLTYNINVPSSGDYTINFRVASRSNGTSFDIYSGNSIVGNISSGATGGWQVWETVSETVSLNQGDQTIRLVSTGNGWNINWLNFSEDDDNGNVDPDPNPVNGSIEVAISNGDDDAEEAESGEMYLDSSDLELVYDSFDNSGNQLIGLRFSALTLPPNATITNAYIQFNADETNSENTELEIALHNSSNSPEFTNSDNNISDRSVFSNTVIWDPNSWTRGDNDIAQRTPDLTSMVQLLVNNSGWSSGNSASFIIRGVGISLTNTSAKRVADSYEGGSDNAARLIVDYTTGAAAKSLTPAINDRFLLGISPNPFTNELTITIPERLDKKYKMIICDLNSKVLYDGFLDSATTNETTIDVVGINQSGIYLLFIKDLNENIIEIRKIVKK